MVEHVLYRTVTLLRTTEELPCNHYCSGKAIRSTRSETVSVALGIQHEIRFRHIVVCDLSRSTIYLSHKRHDYRKNIEYEMCVGFLYN
jgi:hypothetical protein